MDKAEERALAYAKSHAYLGYDYDQTYDAVKYGYLQAEQDLALTADDVMAIVDKYHSGMRAKSFSGLYEEIAKWFNELNQKRNEM